MDLELITHATSNGIITLQKLIIDKTPYTIEGLDIWEGDQVKICNKIYNLHLQDMSPGKGIHDDIFHYKLREVSQHVIKDASEIVSNLIGIEKYEKSFADYP